MNSAAPDPRSAIVTVPASFPPWMSVVFGALAGGLAWGIRGQYGHETGAMIAGLLVSLVFVRLLAPTWPLHDAVRAVAFGTLAMGFGGSMTYGQTVGLTHDADLVGNWAALRWGMLGLSIKGGLWIGFAGAFLGMGLAGRHRYRPKEMVAIMSGLLVLCFVGEYLINSPHEPARRLLPRIYFSADWVWRPALSPEQLKPRREVWGGLLLAFVGLLLYTSRLRRDALPWRLGLWGFLGGALGFPLGQSLQAWHAWNRADFRTGFWATLDPHLNWWNIMETTFGAVMGAVLGLGIWLHRPLVPRSPTISIAASGPPRFIAPAPEAILLGIHVVLLFVEQFGMNRAISRLYDFGIVMAFLPLVLVAGGRASPFLVVLPITLLPIAGKTVRNLVNESHAIGPFAGNVLYLYLPLLLAVALAIRAGRASRAGAAAEPWIGRLLLFGTWIYFGLNYAFFRFPWPWAPWTARTPNAIFYTTAAFALTVFVLYCRRNPEPETSTATPKPPISPVA